MNNARRKTLEKLKARIEALNLDDLVTDLDHIGGEIDDVHTEEQEAFDNLRESLQGGERGQAMQAAIEALETAKEVVEEMTTAMARLEELTDAVDAARQ